MIKIQGVDVRNQNKSSSWTFNCAKKKEGVKAKVDV
jgi:hypothetical protein